MCGIAGALWFDPSGAVDPATLDRMTDVLRHRGPDDRGVYRSELNPRSGYDLQPGVALGHRRLSIIDVAGSRQPLSNEDGTVWITFNGEIYNYLDLRRRLEGSGHQFRTRGDTETIVHLYEDEGLGCLEHLNGMFALALWDAKRRRLVLARDRLGQKPLVYSFDGRRLLFASEIKSLLEVPGVQRDIDPAALDAYLMYQYVPHPRTIYRGINKLPPGRWAVIEDGRLTTGSYWQPDFHWQSERPLADAVEHLRAELTRSVRLRMQSEVPLGAFLSGGIDSSLITALMNGEREHPNRPIRTFSIGFADPEYDETGYARLVAERWGSEHHEFRVEPKALEILPKLVWHYDEPFADSSAIPTYYVSQLAREHVTVALTGDGGDELFAGYERYQAVRWAERIDRWPGPLRRLLASSLWQRTGPAGGQRSVVRKLRRFAESLGHSPQRRFAEWMSIFNRARRAELYSGEFLAQLESATQLESADPFDFLYAAFGRASGRDAVTAASLADLQTYLPCDLLTKVDIASMAHGLECRQPFLDYRVVELAAALPLRYKLHRGQTKWILKQAFADLLPQSIMRRPKMGFGVPLAAWFRRELRDYARQVLTDPQALSRGYFRPEAVRRLLDEHERGAWDHSHRLWSLLFLELWQREWMTRADIECHELRP
jgi:asparagine synthase (glutamine-hydrolysing)